jgi:hypothetical protein
VRVALLAIAALLGVALVVQVVYARMYAANANRTTKVVWGFNIALLAAVLVGIVWYAFGPGVN